MNNDITLLNEKQNKKTLISSTAKVLLLCFAVPFFAMIVIYCCLRVWPVGDHAVLVLDLNAQYVFYFEELRTIILEGESLIYSFSRALGGEFLGIFAYYLSSPFSLLVALFPKGAITEAMYFMLVLKTGCCGLTFGYYLTKKRSLAPMYTVIFSTLYALSSYMVVLQHNIMWVDNVMLFPLILVAVDELICRGKFKMYVICLVYSIMSNFYIGYMTCIFVLVWFFVRYYMLDESEKNPHGYRTHFLRSLGRIALWSLVAVLISAIIILPVYYSLSFGKLEFSDPKYEPTQLFDFLDLLTKAFFGSYDTVRPAGMPFIYCGTLALILALLYFFSPEFSSRRKVGYALMLLFLIIGFNFNIADIVWHGFQKPNWLNARFAYMFVGLVLIMASAVMEKIGKIGSTAVKVSSAFWCVMLLILAKIGYDNLPDFLAVWVGIALFLAFAIILPDCVRLAKEYGTKRIASGALCAVVLIEAIGNGVAMLYSLDKDVTYTTRAAYRELADTYTEAVELMESVDDGTFYRAEKLYHRKKNDNFAVGLNGLSNSTSTLNARAIDLLAQFGFASMSHWSMYSGATPVTDALFGIKYVLADESAKKPVMDYIHDLYDLTASTDEGIDIYENPYSLSIAYAVNGAVAEYDLPAAEGETKRYNDPFTYMNDLLSAMTGEHIEVWTKCDMTDFTHSSCRVLNVKDYYAYEKESDSANLSFKVNVTSDKPIFVYFPSEYPREAKMKLDGEDLGKYFKDDTFSIYELGSFEVGDEFTLKLYPQSEKIYIRKNCDFFYYFNEEVFKCAMELLSDGTMTAYSERDDRIYGTVTVPEDCSLIFTTIPYDAGWQVKIDGESAETVAVLSETLLAVKAEPGEHEIVFEYKPDCVKYGLILTFTGLAIFAAACVVELLLKKRRAKKANSEFVPPIPAPISEAADSAESDALADPDITIVFPSSVKAEQEERISPSPDTFANNSTPETTPESEEKSND